MSAAHRGRFARLSGVALGLIVGGGLIFAAQYPVRYSSATVVLHPRVLTASPAPPAARFPWPSQGSGAASVPALGVSLHSPHEFVQPIASLTKMMTAYLVLQKLPLEIGQSGPCLTVSVADVDLYNQMQASDQSSVKVVLGDRLCEIDLLNGLFVHSAGNYARMLVGLVGENVATFVAQMNATALQMGMDHTSYADVAGFNEYSRSTASDQLKLVSALMRSTLIQSIVRQTSVNLPGAGTVTTYTPLLGTNGVVGVKSGFTDLAGGCDALALQRSKGGITYLVFAVVLGQHSGNVLYNSGLYAYRLAQAASNQVVATKYHTGEVVGTLGWRGASTSVTLGQTVNQLWWQHTPALTVSLAPFTGAGTSIVTPSEPSAPSQLWDWSSIPSLWSVNFSDASVIPSGTVIGDVQFAGDKNIFVVLYSAHRVARPPWWDGLL